MLKLIQNSYSFAVAIKLDVKDWAWLGCALFLELFRALNPVKQEAIALLNAKSNRPRAIASKLLPASLIDRCSLYIRGSRR